MSSMDVREEYKDKIICGDSWAISRALPGNIARTIITSPPYFGHRVYSQSDETRHLEFGCEEQPQEYIDKLVTLFCELGRVLQDDGTLWLNLGDSYRRGQLLGIPWRVALALQDSGWMLRSEIIWSKPNAMPSSVKNRPTLAHEHIFLFSKQAQYFYSADAIREPHVTFSEKSKMRGGRNHFGKRDSTPEAGKNAGNPNLHTARWDQAFHPLGRNKRTVWDVSLGKFREAHFAVFPPELVRTCLLAGSETGDVVFDPFMGSGTVALVARQNDRKFLGSELVPEYVQMALDRLSLTQPPLLLMS